MTNHQSVATVTAMLSQLVQGYAGGAIEGAAVTMQRPDAVPVGGTDAVTNRVNLFLFQAAFDPTRRNDDLATRDSSGRVLQRPKIALELHYLLSFYGDETVLAPQRMMAAVVAGLHARPILSMERAAAFIAEAKTTGAAFEYLADSNLPEQRADVRLVPAALNLEELSKLWSVFFQVPYALSVAYKAAVVVVEADEEMRSTLPVRVPVVTVAGDHTPIAIASVQPKGGGATAPVFANTVLAVAGSGFVGNGLVARLDGARRTSPQRARWPPRSTWRRSACNRGPICWTSPARVAPPPPPGVSSSGQGLPVCRKSRSRSAGPRSPASASPPPTPSEPGSGSDFCWSGSPPRAGAHGSMRWSAPRQDPWSMPSEAQCRRAHTSCDCQWTVLRAC